MSNDKMWFSESAYIIVYLHNIPEKILKKLVGVIDLRETGGGGFGGREIFIFIGYPLHWVQL